MKKDILISIVISVMLLPAIDVFVNKADNKDTKIIVKKGENDNRKLYGIKVADYLIEKSKIKPKMYLGKLFSKYNIEPNIVSEIIEKTKAVFDVRKIKKGNEYTVFLSKDKTREVSYIVYEKNPVDYIIFDFTDSLNVSLRKQKVKTITKTAGSVINSALWFAMEDAGVSPLLAIDLSEIYAWSIDFFGLQKGDKFKIIYEEHFVNGKSIGYGKIKAAFFEHSGKEIYAIPFLEDTVKSFYNIDGTNLKKAFLKAPLKYSRISSGFSHARRHPILKIVRPHHGVDYAAPSGTPVYSLGNGTVIHAKYSRGAGHYIKIKHNNIYTTGYMHLRGYAKGIRKGASVQQGQLIGYVGSTGLSTGAHLDFRVWKNGKNINPLKIDAPKAEPVKEENMKEFVKVKNKYKKLMDKLIIEKNKTEI